MPAFCRESSVKIICQKQKLTLGRIDDIIVTNINVTRKRETIMINELEDALERIKELENENKKLLAELEYYRNRNYGGRKKHDETWMASYNDFASKYENGMTLMEIVAEGKISRRTAYRYKTYYEELKGEQEGK